MGLQIMARNLSLRQNFHVICWRLCTKNERPSEFNTTNVFAQKSICWLRRSFHARKNVLSLKSSHELMERRLPSQMCAVDLVSARTPLSSCAHCFLHCLLLLLGVPVLQVLWGKPLFSYRAGSVWWTCGKRAQEAALCSLPKDPWNDWAPHWDMEQ